MLASFSAIAGDNKCIPFVTVQQLMQSPENYHRKIIVVEGWIRRGREYFALQAVKEPYQKDLIWLDDIEFIKATEQRWPEDKQYRATDEPVLDREAKTKYRKLFAIQKPANVVLKGEFQTAKKGRFGDLAAFRHRLIVYEVISIEARD